MRVVISAHSRSEGRPGPDDPRERGATLVLVSLLLTVLMAAGAFAVDLGFARVTHRRAQAAADAAALAAVGELPDVARTRHVAAGFAGRNMAGARAAAAERPCSGRAPMAGTAVACFGSGGAEIAVEAPFRPTGAVDGAEYVRVAVCEQNPDFFAGAAGFAAPTSCAEAVAERRQVGSRFGTGIVVLSPPDRCPGLLVRGNADISVTTAGAVYVDDTCGRALDNSGTAFTLEAGLISVAGGSGIGCDGCFPAARPVTGQPPVGDVLADLPAPAPPATRSCTSSGNGNNRTTTCAPSRYLGREDFGRQASLVLRPGVHHFEQGVDFGNMDVVVEGPSDPVTGDGVLLYVAQGAVDLSGNGSVVLTPPTRGVYEGISIFQARTNPATSKITGTTGTVMGTVYGPAAKLEIGGNSTWSIEGMLVVAELEMFGNMDLLLVPPTELSPGAAEDIVGLFR